MRHILYCIRRAGRYPRVSLMGAREFRGGVGMTFDNPDRNEAYDAGRELAHLVTLRRFEES